MNPCIDHRPDRCRNGMGLEAKRYTRGVIPQKITDLEDDFGLISRKEAEGLLNGGTAFDGEWLFNLINGLTPEQKVKIKQALEVDECDCPPVDPDQVHTVESVEVDWN